MVRHGVEQGPALSRALLAFVALSALAPVALAGPQDRTRYELTRHIALHGSIQVEDGLFDRAVYRGKSYSDKAPGISFLAVVPFQLERVARIAKAPREWESEGDLQLWSIRVLTSGLLFLAAVWIVLRIAGPLPAAVLGVATLAAPLAPTLFEHDAAGALAIAAFAVLWRRGPPAVAGLAAGTAAVFSYQAALVAAVLGVYAWRRALPYVAGLVPPALALALYNQAAFGSPWRLSYRYVANRYAEDQRGGFFGIGSPSLDGLWDVLFGPRGLVIWSPVCLLAAVGLVLMRNRAALVAGAVMLLFVLANAGYFLPYGGDSPGPRFLAPALPFLVLGLAELPRRIVIPVAAVSAVLTAVQATTWSVRGENATAYLPGKSDVMATVWSLAGLNRNAGAALVLASALGALAVAVRTR